MLSPPLSPEQAFLVLGLMAYLLAAIAAWAGVHTRLSLDRLVINATAIAVFACLLSILLRWLHLSLIHISEPTRPSKSSRMPSSA